MQILKGLLVPYAGIAYIKKTRPASPCYFKCSENLVVWSLYESSETGAESTLINGLLGRGVTSSLISGSLANFLPLPAAFTQIPGVLLGTEVS